MYLTFGQHIRFLRKKERLPLRKIAAHLDLDPSTLGKIEKNTRKASPEIIGQLAGIFKVAEKELMVSYQSDLIISLIKDYSYPEEILQEVQKKLQNKTPTQ